MPKIHRFQLEGKLKVAAIALGLEVETLRAATEGLLDIQEPRDYTLITPTRDWRYLPGPQARWRFVWKVPDDLRDSGFNAREARFSVPDHIDVLFLAANEVIFDLRRGAPSDMNIPIQW